MPSRKRPSPETPSPLKPDQLRWRCDPEKFEFRTTKEIGDRPINIIGQDRAQEALRLGLALRSDGYNIFVTGDVGNGRSTVVRRMLAELDPGEQTPDDLVYVHNFKDVDQPRRLTLPAGKGREFRNAMRERIDAMTRDLPRLYDSEEYRKHRSAMVDAAEKSQKGRLKDFEKKVQDQGFALVQVQMGPVVRPQIVPVVTGNPMDMDQLEQLVEQGQFEKKEYKRLQHSASELRHEMESVGKAFRNQDRELRRQLANLDRELAAPLVQETLADVRETFSTDGLDVFLDELQQDILDAIDEFREVPEPSAAAEKHETGKSARPHRVRRYQVNLVVDNSATRGRPIIWETAPSYRNLFGTIEKMRTGNGEWESDHMCIKAGSLLRASGGFLVLDAMDVLVEPAVWSALKRTLRNRAVEIQSFDPFHIFASSMSLKPERAEIDVKVLIIGTRHIYRVLHSHDEDFKKIFKVKAEFAMWTPLSDEELRNYARFVNKKVQDDGIPPFQREAVAAVVEHGVRLSGSNGKLTTRFTEIADVIRESGYWASRANARAVRVEHVDRALMQRAHRVDLIEEVLRERIAEGTVLIDLDGEKVGQVNGLAVLDLGDHVFALPSRITANTAMGRAGIIDIDREAEMAGSIHTKGVLILTGFLRARFAQTKPLTLTASICFEQNYGGVEGDSASSAELYALLSSLSGVPIRQGIALTGSVNQKGEIQPIGGVNEKIEGYFDLCRLLGLTGNQGVMIPSRNLQQLTLRKDVVAAVRQKKFNVWAVADIEQGLEVLTGVPAGRPGPDGSLPEESILGRVDAALIRLAREVAQFGPADSR